MWVCVSAHSSIFANIKHNKKSIFLVWLCRLCARQADVIFGHGWARLRTTYSFLFFRNYLVMRMATLCVVSMDVVVAERLFAIPTSTGSVLLLFQKTRFIGHLLLKMLPKMVSPFHSLFLSLSLSLLLIRVCHASALFRRHLRLFVRFISCVWQEAWAV